VRDLFHKILSISLALLVFFSTSSFTIHEHYCGGKLVDSSIFLSAKTCSSEMEEPSSEEGCAIQKNNCCEDKVIILEGQDELKTSTITLNLEQQLFVASFIYTYVNLFDGLKENIIPFKDYVPPLVTRQLFKLDETYLI